jgi:RNA-directed DNA polymerase
MTAFRLAMRGCGATASACSFFFHLERELLRLKNDLISGIYQPGNYHYFKTYDPKERTIAVAPFRDRVVHHAIVRILTPIYERIFIYDSYATRQNKGTHAAILRAQAFSRKWAWYLKTDILKYFDSTDHDILMSVFERKLKDRKLLDLMNRIIRNSPVPEKGLPIGNLTSQFFANVYLDPLDHEIRDRKGVHGYLRYMDDFVLFGDSKQYLLDLRAGIEAFLQERLKLRLKPEATRLNRTFHGLSFLGMRIFPNYLRVRPENRKRSIRRAIRTVRAWQNSEIDEQRAAQSVTSIIGHLHYFCPDAKLFPGVGIQ